MPTTTGAMRRSVTGIVALAMMVVGTSACTSAPAATSTPSSGTGTGAATGSSQPPPASAGQTGMMPLANCLNAHGVQLQRIGALFGLAANSDSQPVSQSTLKSAGVACTPYAGNLESEFQQFENCLTEHGATVASTGSALTDLLLLDQSKPDNARALARCQQEAQSAPGG